MAFSYVGNFPNQQVSNSGVLSLDDINNLESTGELGGSLELLQSQTFSSTVSYIDFTSIKESKYDVHFMTLNNMKTAGDNQDVVSFRFYESGVLETASVYNQFNQTVSTISGLTDYERRSTSASYITYLFGTGTATGEQVNGYAYFYNLGNTNKYSFMSAQFMGLSNATLPMSSFGGGLLPQASVVDGIRVMKNTGDYSGFKVKLYGVKQI